ncbi:hypothetical protein EMCRGX_G026411 [Ephydatia muelleri]
MTLPSPPNPSTVTEASVTAGSADLAAEKRFGSADNDHLQHAVVVFNSQVSIPNTITVESALASPISQKVLSGLLAFSSPGPSIGLDLRLEHNEYQTWWLELDTSAALAAETLSNGPKCQELGWSCIPLAVETYGNSDKEAQDTFSRLASHLAIPPTSLISRGNLMAIDKSKSSCAFDIRPIAVNACALLRKAAKFFQPLFPAL